MTKREKRLRDLRRTIASWETRREAAIRTLVRSETQLPALRKRAERLAVLLLKAGTPVEEPPTIRQAAPMGMCNDGEVVVEPDIPEFLRRGIAAQKAVDDVMAAQEIEREIAAKKKTKAAHRIEKLKISQEIKQAELTGQRRKMPLTGKEALAAIRAGR
jgi:hypothetical protein